MLQANLRGKQYENSIIILQVSLPISFTKVNMTNVRKQAVQNIEMSNMRRPVSIK